MLHENMIQEKIALRRMVQSYLVRLDETIVEMLASGQDVPMLCRFCKGNIIIWQDKPYTFSPSTYSLLREFFKTPGNMLSKEDVRQDVLYDEYAREGTLRQCISAARKELKKSALPYRIETVTAKGYRLVSDWSESF